MARRSGATLNTTSTASNAVTFTGTGNMTLNYAFSNSLQTGSALKILRQGDSTTLNSVIFTIGDNGTIAIVAANQIVTVTNGRFTRNGWYGRTPINGTVDIGSGGSIYQDGASYPVIGQAYYYAFYGLNSGTLEMGNNSLVAYYGGDTSGGLGKTRGIVANFTGFTVGPGASTLLCREWQYSVGHRQPNLQSRLEQFKSIIIADFNQTWSIRTATC